MTLILTLCGIVLYLGIAFLATRFTVHYGVNYTYAFKPMTVGDALFLLCCVFTPLSIGIIVFAISLKVETLNLENLIGGKKILQLANWMFLPRKSDASK